MNANTTSRFPRSLSNYAQPSPGLVTGCLIALLAAMLPVSALDLTLKPVASVPGKEFFVGDLVMIRDGIPPAILATKMGPTPTFKEPALLTRPMIEMALKNQNLLWDPVVWHGATNCTVNRPSRFVTVQDLRTVILPALARITGGAGTYTIEEFSGLLPMEIPAGHAQASVELNPNSLTNEWTNASVSFLIDGEVVLNRSIRFHWSWVREVWVADHDLAMGEKISAEKFHQVRTNSLQGHALVVNDPASFNQFQLARPLHLGQVLTQEDVKESKIVYKGGKVTVRYSAGGIQITMVGVALEDGIRGGTIPVMNTTSHARLLARIIDPDNLQFIQAL